MSAAPFRQAQDPARLAALGATLEGAVPLAALPRLAPVFGPDGPGDSHATAVLQFSAHPRGLVLIEGQIDGQLRLRCQRCLEGLLLPIAERFRLALPRDATTAEAPGDFELLERQGETLVPADLLEDELLLAVPLVARHASVSECGPLASRQSEGPIGGERTRPFEGLRQLRERSKDSD